MLALGVFVMYALGHPDRGSGPGVSHSTHRGAGEARPAPYGVDRGGGTVATGSSAHRAAPAPSVEAGHVSVAPETKPREPMTGMDMASLCVAVLGAWVFGVVLRAVLARRSDPPPGLPGVAGAVPRLDPPSRRPDLTALSVLWI